MTRASRDEILRDVGHNLAFLHEEWDHSIEIKSLRATSILLRHLLVENYLQRAWKSAGFEKEPRIIASSLLPYMKRAAHVIELGWAGGARVKGVGEFGPLMPTGHFGTDEEARELTSIESTKEEIGLHDFIEAPSVIVRGEVIPRRAVIKYMVNTQGVAHSGEGKKKWSDEERRQYRRLDESKHAQGGPYPVPFLELLSIGQMLVGADDIKRLREKIAQIVGPANLS